MARIKILEGHLKGQTIEVIKRNGEYFTDKDAYDYEMGRRKLMKAINRF